MVEFKKAALHSRFLPHGDMDRLHELRSAPRGPSIDCFAAIRIAFPVSSQLLAPHVSVEEPGERDNLSFFEGLDDELEEDCSRENEIITLLMTMRDDKSIALQLCSVIPEFSKNSGDFADFCPSL